MRTSPNFTVVYVITSDGKDVYADMALVSMLSVRISDPGRRIVALCDASSATALRGSGHALLEQCDELISVETPEGQPTFRNRWIKARVGQFVRGPVLYLDADTLVRKPLSGLTQAKGNVLGARNHNGTIGAQQIWAGDRAILREMGWPESFVPAYINGGVLFSRSGEECSDFWQKWPDTYDEGVQKTGSHRDQPSLNSALSRSNCQFEVLADAWNAQVVISPASAFDAGIWHFYLSKEDKEGTVFSELLTESQTASSADLRVSLEKVLRKRIPWTKKSSVHHVENTIWEAYRQGARLRWSELGLLLGRRPNWKNVLLSLFAGAGLSYEQFTKFLVWASRCRSRVVAPARS